VREAVFPETESKKLGFTEPEFELPGLAGLGFAGAGFTGAGFTGAGLTVVELPEPEFELSMHLQAE